MRAERPFENFFMFASTFDDGRAFTRLRRGGEHRGWRYLLAKQMRELGPPRNAPIPFGRTGKPIAEDAEDREE